MPATTAPLTTLATISTDITSPSTPNATMNGTHGAIELVALQLGGSGRTARRPAHPWGSDGRAATRCRRSARRSYPALAKRYSICDASGVPGPGSAVSSAGVTHACAVPVIDVAMPTIVSFGVPGTPVTVICVPTGGTQPLSGCPPRPSVPAPVPSDPR